MTNGDAPQHSICLWAAVRRKSQEASTTTTTREAEPMKTEQVLMTPQWAEQLLKRNLCNRPLSATRVRAYAKAILQGEWLLSHQGIAVAENGDLLDGQHRLHAIIATGRAMPLLLSSGCSRSTFAVIDTGYKRGPGQALGIAGVSSSKEAAAACRLAMAYERIPNLVWGSTSISYTNADIVAWYEGAGPLFDVAVKMGLNGRSKFTAIRQSALSAFLYFAARAGFAEATLLDFTEQLCDGDGIAKDNPVFGFRRAIINRSADLLTNSRAKSSQAWMASFIVVFNSWVQRRPVKVFRTPAFPPMPEIWLHARTTLSD